MCPLLLENAKDHREDRIRAVPLRGTRGLFPPPILFLVTGRIPQASAVYFPPFFTAVGFTAASSRSFSTASCACRP